MLNKCSYCQWCKMIKTELLSLKLKLQVIIFFHWWWAIASWWYRLNNCRTLMCSETLLLNKAQLDHFSFLPYTKSSNSGLHSHWKSNVPLQNILKLPLHLNLKPVFLTYLTILLQSAVIFLKQLCLCNFASLLLCCCCHSLEILHFSPPVRGR